MNIKRYFIPLDISNLSKWLSGGVIYPCVKNPDWINDVQKEVSGNCIVLLEKGKYAGNSDCSIEVELLSEDENIAKEGKNIFYKGFIPQSRIIKVYFKTQEALDISISNINDGNAFLDKSYCEIDLSSNVQLERLSVELKKADSDSNVKFDKVMGGFCMLRMIVMHNNGPFDLLIELIRLYSGDLLKDLDAYYKKTNYLSSYDEAKELINISSTLKAWSAKKNKNYPFKISGLFDSEKVGGVDLMYCLLGTYGSLAGGASVQKGIDGFIKECTIGEYRENKDMLPETALWIGYKDRYSSLRSFYLINDGNYKFELKLDILKPFHRFMLECIFQYCFNKESASAYDYAKSILEKDAPIYKANRVVLLGEEFNVKKKESQEQQEIQENSPEETYSNKLSVSSYESLVENNQKIILNLKEVTTQMGRFIEEYEELSFSLIANLKNLENEKLRLEAEKASLKTDIASLESDKTTLLDENQKLEESNTSLKTDIASLESDKTTLLDEKLELGDSKTDPQSEDINPKLINEDSSKKNRKSVSSRKKEVSEGLLFSSLEESNTKDQTKKKRSSKSETKPAKAKKKALYSDKNE